LERRETLEEEKIRERSTKKDGEIELRRENGKLRASSATLLL